MNANEFKTAVKKSLKTVAISVASEVKTSEKGNQYLTIYLDVPGFGTCTANVYDKKPVAKTGREKI